MKHPYPSLLTRIAGVAVITTFCTAGLFAAAPATTQGVTSDQALSRLKDGNTRFVQGKQTRPNQDAARRALVAAGQNPFVSILSCADSRVPVELLFDQGIGDLFVIRVAGNVADTDEIGTIEYGVGHLGTPLLVVMGHTSCGAVKAVVEKADVHGSIPQLVDNIVPAVAKARMSNPGPDKLIQAAIKANVFISIEDILNRSHEVRELVEQRKLKIVGAIYNLKEGTVEWLGPHPEESNLVSHGTPHSGGHTAGHAPASTPAAHATPATPHAPKGTSTAAEKKASTAAAPEKPHASAPGTNATPRAESGHDTNAAPKANVATAKPKPADH